MSESTLTAKREDIAPRQVALEVVVDEERLERSLRTASRKISRHTKIPGFRPGKAPHDIVVRMVGEQAVLGEAIEELGPQLYREAVEEAGLQPFDRGELQVVSEEPLTFRMTVPLEPEVKLPDYRAWEYDPPQVEVTEEDLQAALEEVREAFAEQAPVERSVQLEDLVTLDVQAEFDGKELLKLDAVNFIPRQGSPGIAPGFSEAVVALQAGEAKTFELTFPEDYQDEELRGRTARFEVQVHSVNERRLPPVDDELARSAALDSLAELRERLRQSLEARRRLEARSELAEQVLQRLVSESEIEYPPIALDREINHLVVEQAIVLRQRGFTLEGYLEASGTSQEAYHEQLREEARDHLERALVLSEIVRREEIRVEEAEVRREVDRLAGRYGERAEEARQFFSSASASRSTVARLYGQKALQKVVAVVTGREEELERERLRRQIALPGEEGEQRTAAGIIVPGQRQRHKPEGGIIRPK